VNDIAKIQEITVRGILLNNQFMTWDSRLIKRRVSVGRKAGVYVLQDDGSLEFCLGVKSIQPHVVCRLQCAAAWLGHFNKAIGKRISVSGFLRCTFQTAGFNRSDNAHIFEIHPVRTVQIDGELHSIELDVPHASVKDWNDELNNVDEQRQVRFWKGGDRLVFSNVEIEKQTYVRVTGNAGDIKLNLSTNRPAWFILDSPQTRRQVKVTCLQGTRAARQLRDLHSSQATVIGLRSVDLGRALEDRYRINLFGNRDTTGLTSRNLLPQTTSASNQFRTI
jgi:hypothetical protein